MLKDLVWKEDDRKYKILMLKENFARELFSETGVNIDNVPLHKVMDTIKELINQYDAAEQEILNTPTEYTKQDVIDMFVEAGFQCNKHNTQLTYISNNSIRLRLIFSSNDLVWFEMDKPLVEGEIRSNVLGIDDRKRIDFYYNKFREILEFEVNVRD